MFVSQNKSTLIDFTNGEVKTLSQIFWDRELCIMNIKITFQSYGINNNLILRCIKDIRQQDKIWRDQEEVVIGKYFKIKTDLHYQRILVLKILEQMLINFKKIIPQYEDQNMQTEVQFLKKDMDKLRSDVKDILSNNSRNLSQTLSFLTHFSKQRLDYHLRVCESQVIRSTEDKNNQNKTTREEKNKDFSIMRKSIVPSKDHTLVQSFINDQHAQTDQKFFTVASDTKLDEHQPKLANKSDGIVIYYKNIFRKHQKNNDQKIMNDTEPILQENTFVQPSIIQSPSKAKTKSTLININPGNYSNLNNHRSYSNHTTTTVQFNKREQSATVLEPNNYQRYLSTQIQKNQKVNQLDNALSLDDPQQYYKNINMEMKNLPETDKKTFLYKYFKESMKTNLQIQTKLEQFRLTYLLFLQKKNSSAQKYTPIERSQRSYTKRTVSSSNQKVFWTQLYDTLRERRQKSMISMINHKEINKICAAVSHTTHTVEQSPQRPKTSVVKYKTESSDIYRNRKLDVFYCPKFKCKVQTLTSSQFDYFNL